MRDIVSAGYNNSATLPVKNKIERTNSSGGLKNDYKSYRDFLESYGDKNSKDDQESVSSTDSGISSSYKLSESKSNNTSTSSLNSEFNGSSSKTLPKSNTNIMTARTGSFKNYMENYSNKKFIPVKPNVLPKQNTIKSELVIQVNEPVQNPKELDNVVRSTVNDGTRPNVNKIAVIPIICPKPIGRNDTKEVEVTYATNISETLPPSKSSQEIEITLPPPPPPLPITQVNNFSVCENGFIPPPPPIPILNLQQSQQGKKWETVKVGNTGTNSTQQNQPERFSSNDAAANLAKILTQHLLPRRKELERLEEAQKANENGHEIIINNNQLENQKFGTLPKYSGKRKPPQLPLSPPPKQQNSNIFLQKKSSLPPSPIPSRQNKTSSENPQLPRFPVFSPTMARRFQNIDTTDNSMSSTSTLILPNQSQKITVTSQKKPVTTENFLQRPEVTEKCRLPPSPQSKLVNGRDSPNSNGNVDFNTTTVVPISDTAAKVSKTDPNVRKLVYNTYRGLLGAYNNKANDMIATLPRNMVREDKGIAKQLESITLQGGLEKLNGRTNPNVEQE